ncbi:MAG: aminomethyltransferase family protein, partial [Pseudomonadota bacterium]
ISDAMVGFSISGPKSRDILASVTHEDVSHAAMPFMACKTMDVGMIRAQVARLSVTGELGYEINCPASEHITLYRTLKEAGAAHGMVDIGFNALLSLRLEKSFGIWSAEFMQDYTPGMTGMDRWIDWSKEGFLGRDAAIAERDGNGPAHVQRTIEVQADGADASGYEPIWAGEKRVGYVTSGGYGHTTDKSLAMALIEPDHAAEGTELSVHIVGVERAAKVIAASPHDPEGKAMRM